MILKKWDDLPDVLKNEEVRKYYNILDQKRMQLWIKRFFDIFASVILLFGTLPIILFIAILVRCTSSGPIFFRQQRITKYGKVFRIFKFRTMVHIAENKGSNVTLENDTRVTRLGRFLRKFRLDELPQIFNILSGQMSFVGTRPEVLEYVERYLDEMKATLLMSAGVTSLASIKFKDESKLLKQSCNIDKTYVEQILPQKMKYNLLYLREFGFFYDIKLMLKTVFSMLK